MNKEIAEAALKLLARVQVAGSEVDAYVTVRAALANIASGAQVVSEPQEKEDEVTRARKKAVG